MSDYKRLTNEELHDFISRVVVQLNPALTQQVLSIATELLVYRDKIESAEKIQVHYKPPYEIKYAIVKYDCRQGKPLKVEEYYIYGEELKTNNELRCWTNVRSTNFSVIEFGFDNEEKAKQRLKEIKNG